MRAIHEKLFFAPVLDTLAGTGPLPEAAAEERLAAFGFHCGDVIHEPHGCERCGGTGYRGRLGVFELLELDNSLRELIGERTDGLKIDQTAIKNGMTTMLDDGIAKCRAGLTSPAEILRVTTTR